MIRMTGATGFIGPHILRRFQEAGESISAVTRAEADIRDADALRRAFAGADCVVHNAALARDWGAWECFRQNNVEGARNVAAACVAAGVRHLIVTSSCSVYGEEDCATAKNEQSPMRSRRPYFLGGIFPSAMNFYRDSKRLAKEAALGFSERLRICFIEPVWVYGEGERHTGFLEYLQAAKSGAPFLPGARRNKFHCVYAGDVAEAYLLARRKNAEGSFLIGPEKADLMSDVFAEFCRAAGLRKPRDLPKSAAMPVGFALEALWALCHAKNPPPLTRARAAMFYDSIEYDCSKARRELGFECKTSLAEGAARAVAWYKKEGLL
jgi:Nucleoside-diphosphate-sugar epimerases